jgi:hypothetical protein
VVRRRYRHLDDRGWHHQDNQPAHLQLALGKPENTDPEELREKRRMLALGNASRAWITLLSVILMACQFSVEGTVVAAAACAIIAYPSLWLARKYMPTSQ